MYSNYYLSQSGGGNCTLCGSPNTNKSTCPLNPNVVNPNPQKHPFAVRASAASAPLVPAKALKTQTVEERYTITSTVSPIESVTVLAKTKAKKVMKQVTLIDMPPNGCAVGKIGKRSAMEDEHVTVSYDDAINLYAVFDGHAGARVSKLLVKELPDELYESLKDIDIDDENLVKKAIIDAYVRIDEKIYNMNIQDGSTAVAILQIYDMLYFINLGDSRAILVDVRTGEVIHATVDQKPAKEETRIKDAGGYVLWGRVNGVLAVARAFGDSSLKHDKNGEYSASDAPVSAEPVITTYKMQPSKTYIAVLACDGLWDVMDNDEVAEELPPIGQLGPICGHLIDSAIKIGSTDNVSVMITVLTAP